MDNLFYVPHLEEGQFSLPDEEAFHALKVLRVKRGDELELTNGKGNFAKATVADISKKGIVVNVQHVSLTSHRPVYLHIAIAPTKNADRFEWFLEKATEIGVEEITPVICSRSERKEVKWERSHKLLVAAMKQSKQYFLPKLNEAIRFDDFIEQQHNGILCIAHCGEGKKIKFRKMAERDHITLLIGPEGDFTGEEIEKAKQKEAVEVSLGATRLRTETAGIWAAVSFVNVDSGV